MAAAMRREGKRLAPLASSQTITNTLRSSLTSPLLVFTLSNLAIFSYSPFISSINLLIYLIYRDQSSIGGARSISTQIGIVILSFSQLFFCLFFYRLVRFMMC
jgi:hypothetical protein